MRTPGRTVDKEPEPLALLIQMTESAAFGGACGLLDPKRPSAPVEPFSSQLHAAAAGAVTAFILYCFAEPSGRSLAWYYLVWSASIAAVVTGMRLPFFIGHETSGLELLATAYAGAVGGMGLARMAERYERGRVLRRA